MCQSLTTFCATNYPNKTNLRLSIINLIKYFQFRGSKHYLPRPWWWWAFGQRAHLLFPRSEFESCVVYNFHCVKLLEKNKITRKRGRKGQLKTEQHYLAELECSSLK